MVAFFYKEMDLNVAVLLPCTNCVVWSYSSLVREGEPCFMVSSTTGSFILRSS